MAESFSAVFLPYERSLISNKNYTNAEQSLDTKTQIFDFGYAFQGVFWQKKPPQQGAVNLSIKL